MGTTKLTDSAVAEFLMAELFLDRWVHCHGLGWLAWDGRRWQERPDKAALEAARTWTKGRWWTAACAFRDGTGLKSTVDVWADRLDLRALSACVKLLAGMVSVDPDRLDAEPDLLNVRNGVVDLRHGTLRPHDPGLYLTKLAPVEFDPTAVHEDWTAALRAVPAEVESWLQVRYGQGVTGHMTSDDRVLIQQGGGSNGKSTVLSAVAGALGDYYLLASDKILIGAQNGAHTTDLADLRGSRFVAVEETPEAGRLDVVRLKKLAGTERITARKMYRDNVSFPASHTLFVNTNYPPVVGETDEGTWRRLLLVNFPYTFTSAPAGEEERHGDPGLRDRLLTGATGQREAVLAWLVEGAGRWYEQSRVFPGIPDVVARDTGEWRGRTDHVAAFWGDHLEADPNAYVYAGDLIWLFNQYMRQHGNAPLAESTFMRRFVTHPLTTSRLVTKRRISTGSRQSLQQSRPFGALDPFSRLPGVPDGQVQAWVGVAFRQATAGDAWSSDLRERRDES